MQVLHQVSVDKGNDEDSGVTDSPELLDRCNYETFFRMQAVCKGS